jgi:FkbM family methyltransferase
MTGGSSIVSLYSEVFCKELYASPAPLGRSPRIVDAGGHLGLASLYFLHRYPGCQLTTLEPNPSVAPLLRRTLAPYATRATLLEAALSTATGSSPFHITTDNRVNVTGGIENREPADRAVTRLTVSRVDACQLLSDTVDLLKLDVEGHEFELLPLPVFAPHHVRNLVVEFHDVERRADQFRALMHVLRDERGYRITNSQGRELTRDALQRLNGCPVLKLSS